MFMWSFFQQNYTFYVLLLHNINKHSCDVCVFTKWLSSDSAVLFSLCWLSFFFLFCQILTTFTVSELLNYSKYQNLHQKTYLVVTHLKEWRLVWKSGDREWKTKSCTGRGSKKNSNWVTNLWQEITKPW